MTKERNYCRARNLFISSIILISINCFIFGAILPLAIFLPTSVNTNGFGIINIILIVVCGVIFIVANFLINLINAIWIFTSNFESVRIDEQKIVWGIFTLVILGPIASLIFAIQANNSLNPEKNKWQKELNNERNDAQFYQLQQNVGNFVIDQNDTISKNNNGNKKTNNNVSEDEIMIKK